MNYVLSPSAVQKIRRAITPKLGDVSRPSSSPSTVSFDLYPPPYTVRWAASLASAESSEGAGDATDGEWIIYLPTSGLLMVGGTSVDLTTPLEAAGAPYPAGWYKLVADYEESGTAEPILDRSTGGTLYLVISGPSAQFSDEPGGAATSSVKIAIAAVNSTTSARTIKQLVTSSIVITGAGSVPAGAGCYALVEVEETNQGQTVTRKYLGNQYYVDGGVIKSTNFSNPLDPATHYGKFLALRAPMTSNGTAALAAYDTFALMHTASLDPNYITIALYQLDANGDIVCDFRNIPHAQAAEDLS